MELCFNVRTFFSTVYPFRSFLIPLGRTCTPSIAFRFSSLYNTDGTIKQLDRKQAIFAKTSNGGGLYGIFNFTHCTGGILYLVAAAYGEAAQRKAWKMCGLSLSGDWNVPIKAAFCPNRRTLFPNSRIWVQTVDEDGFPAYAEDTVK